MTISFEEYFDALTEDFPEIAEHIGSEFADFDLKPLDSNATSYLVPILAGIRHHNIWLVEALLDQSIDHLNNCLDLRDEGQSLENMTVNHALDMALAIKLQNKDAESIEIQRQDQTRYKAVSEQTELNKSAEGKIEGSDQSIDAVNRIQDQFIDVKDHKLNEVIRHTLAKTKMSQVDGSASNYLQRFERAREVFVNEFKNAYSKLVAVQDGLKVVYDISTPLPEITDSGYLDKLYLWATNTVYRLDHHSLQQHDYVVYLPLSQGHFSPEADNDSQKHVLVSNFTEQRAAGVFTFELPKEKIFPNIDNPRIRKVAVLVRDDQQNPWFEAYSVKVAAPAQKNAQSQLISQPPLETTAYSSMQSMAQSAPYVGSLYHNTDPTAGEWQISIAKRGSRNTDRTGLEDVVLVLYVAGIPSL